MSHLLDYAWAITGHVNSRIQLETEGTTMWEVWHRFLLLDGRRAYLIGNVCNTCEFFFERMEGANDRVEVEHTAEALRNGITSVSDSVVEQIGKSLPPDEYLVCLLETTPWLVQLGGANDYFHYEQIDNWGVDGFWGLPHHPKVPYYRCESRKPFEAAKLFELWFPCFLTVGLRRKHWIRM